MNEPEFYGDLEVEMRSESVLSDYTIRILDVKLASDLIKLVINEPPFLILVIPKYH